jgi:hypothetical protein
MNLSHSGGNILNKNGTRLIESGPRLSGLIYALKEKEEQSDLRTVTFTIQGGNPISGRVISLERIIGPPELTFLVTLIDKNGDVIRVKYCPQRQSGTI